MWKELDIDRELKGFSFTKVDHFIFTKNGKEYYCEFRKSGRGGVFSDLFDLLSYVASRKLYIYKLYELTDTKECRYVLRSCEVHDEEEPSP